MFFTKTDVMNAAYDAIEFAENTLKIAYQKRNAALLKHADLLVQVRSGKAKELIETIDQSITDIVELHTDIKNVEAHLVLLKMQVKEAEC